MINELQYAEGREEDAKSVQEVSKSGRAKSHTDYWAQKVFRPTYRVNGALRQTACYSIKIQFAGRRELFALNTANKPEAAKTAKRIWVSLAANGWDTTLREFKPQAVYVPPLFVTVGDYIDFLKEHQFYAAQTLYGALTKFYTALGSMFENEKPRSRYDARKSGLREWRARLRAVRLVDITPQKVEEWKNSYLAARSENPERLLRAKHTLDAYLRAAKAMFGPRIRKRLAAFGVKIPEPVPFESTEFVSRGRSAFRYRSRMDPIHLTRLALQELRGSRFDQLKIFLLALHVGLRRKEIDGLLWSQFDFERCKLRIEATEYTQLKTEGSAEDLGIEPELAGFFRDASSRARGIFVIETECSPRTTSGWSHYRAQGHFDQLCIWLRTNGVRAQKPIHTLRKEFGRLIAEKLGLYAASLALRHTSPNVTATYYADDTRPKHTGLGKLIGFAG